MPVAAPVTAPAVAARPSRVRRSALDDESHWSRFALLALLAMAFAAQLIVGLVFHLIQHRQRLLVVDLFFFQAPFVLAACVVLMPLAKVVTHQPRMLRMLEALSIGAVFALFALLLTSLLVHPATGSTTLTTDQLIDRLTINDALGIVLADVLAMVVTVQLFPSLQRILSAPGRRARARMLERRAEPGSRSSAASRDRAKASPRSRR
jgi:ABC-type transport system involved in cytochrome c biogenesis permease subunit